MKVRVKSLITIVAVGVLVSASTSCDRCEDEDVASVSSPSGKRTAVITEQRCGRDRWHSDVVRVYVTESKNGGRREYYNGGANFRATNLRLTVEWLDDAAVVVSARGIKTYDALGLRQAPQLVLRDYDLRDSIPMPPFVPRAVWPDRD